MGIFTTIYFTDLVILGTVAMCWRVLAIRILPHSLFLSNADLEPLNLLDSKRLFYYVSPNPLGGNTPIKKIIPGKDKMVRFTDSTKMSTFSDLIITKQKRSKYTSFSIKNLLHFAYYVSVNLVKETFRRYLRLLFFTLLI